MEEEFKRKGLTRAPMASNIRSKRTIVDANWEKFVDKAQGNSYPSNKNFCSGTYSSQGSSSSCHGFGHVFSISFKAGCYVSKLIFPHIVTL